MAGPAAPVSAAPGIAGWAGLLVPYDQSSVDGRMIRRPPGGARVRDLPIELKYQEAATCGHDGALIGLASITRVWETDEGLWGSGPFDMEDPKGKELARKVDQGFVGHVSVDLGDFRTAAQQTPKGVVEAVTDWKLLSTTIVADAAMDGARIFTVRDPEAITPMSVPLAARREAAGVFAADRATLTFAKSKQGMDDEEMTAVPGVTLTITGASNLPWAPKETRWDAAGATRRMVEHCGGRDNLNPECFGRAFLFREAGADPSLIGSYKFPFADVVDGEVRAVWRAVANAASRVGQAGITSADAEAVRGKIRSLYASAGKAFGEDIAAPFSADTTTSSYARSVHMAEDAAAVTAQIDAELPDVGDQVAALAEQIVTALAPRMTEAVSAAIEGAIAAVMAEVVGPPADEEPEMVDEEIVVEEMPPAMSETAMLSAVVLRMASAVAARRLSGSV
jgi:hypothetical protein